MKPTALKAAKMVKKGVHEHERHMHKGMKLTKLTKLASKGGKK